MSSQQTQAHIVDNCLKTCVKIKLKDNGKLYSRSDVLKGLKLIISAEERKLVDYCSSYGSCYKWMIGTTNEMFRQSIIGQHITVDDQDCAIMDAENRDVIKTLRFLWLPKGFPIQTVIIDKLKSFGEVTESFLEDSSDDEFEFCKTGNLRVKIKVARDKASKLNDLLGIKKWGSFRFVVQMMGERQGCFLCKSKNHVKKDCPKLKLTCTKCKGRGHTTAECNMALRLEAKNLMHNFDDDYVQAEIITETNTATQVPETVAQVTEIATQGAETVAQATETLTQGAETVAQATETVTQGAETIAQGAETVTEQIALANTAQTTTQSAYNEQFPTIAEGGKILKVNQKLRATSTPIQLLTSIRSKNTRNHEDMDPSLEDLNFQNPPENKVASGE
jgi:Zinc knuckle